MRWSGSCSPCSVRTDSVRSAHGQATVAGIFPPRDADDLGNRSPNSRQKTSLRQCKVACRAPKCYTGDIPQEASMASKRTIRSSWPTPIREHRERFSKCPHCDHDEDYVKWLNDAHTLILEPSCSKRGSVAVVTDCPKCFEPSWLHRQFEDFHEVYVGVPEVPQFPPAWRNRVSKHAAAVHLSVIREWKNGLCGGCKKLESGEMKYSAWRTCGIGSGPIQTACDKYQEVK